MEKDATRFAHLASSLSYTDKHPAQVEVYMEDVPVGTWKTVKYSGALPATTVNALIERVESIQDAVKSARAKANDQDVQNQTAGQVLMDYMFQPLKKA